MREVERHRWTGREVYLVCVCMHTHVHIRDRDRGQGVLHSRSNYSLIPHPPLDFPLPKPLPSCTGRLNSPFSSFIASSSLRHKEKVVRGSFSKLLARWKY